MRLDEKARENLEAAGRLLPDDDGQFESLSNASASRAYYAAYLAVADAALQRGCVFTGTSKDGEKYFRHDSLPGDVVGWRILAERQANDLDWLRGLRIKADYREDQIDLEEASEALDVATSLLDALLQEGNR